jgi:hypothetical protein
MPLGASPWNFGAGIGKHSATIGSANFKNAETCLNGIFSGEFPVFKIARLHVDRSSPEDFWANDNSQASALSQFCVSENWTGDMSTGLLKLGARTVQIHGLKNAECGLLNLVRCYDQIDRNKILEPFEQATTHASSFCFSTTISNARGHRQPVFCIGESSGLEMKLSGSIVGIFMFPRFAMDIDPALTTGSGLLQQ